ncbi:hypothetical protein C1Y08_04085 [Pseudomonas sp. FW306-02-F02-AA]|uniref:Dermonecrotic toxin N-terminal domain-containing protein n=1 Tax=Pseudomonas fluorescens TaxID=294 RepID=A0A0N9W4T6_PSEFL|nr:MULTISPECIES: DUF6543 domain-containing protein [Pseudomonas]ALI01381.1 hypothetical protein AO353_09985 [Pseudomonas fluorescens]PMZ05906.1 hypothetical protein C1Y07_02670 [Pseudomonas sp. FW306-02-F02-AB]PMZ11476.1 hypothetical protein C1Y06_04400 [Pseudomonas sp. FW306-02-H06C]PMZ17399.1 hypothetical protein C1Y08_04085 [Pseudomonas sp. FW306-02-F02-AA]PMZ23116.1 hypothetical protein C1Y09_05745 [Pseudomonas sp. FW306-02-F08-AA]
MTDNVPLETSSDTTRLVEKSDLVTLTSHGPTLNQIASNLMTQALKELYPDLDIDPDHAMIATPQWLQVDNRIEVGPFRFESLTHALIRHSFNTTKANYIEGEHFLTLERHAKDPIHLAVSIEEVAGVLNDSAPLLFVEFQARQLDFWNQKGHRIARWQELSDTLRKALNVRQVNGWDADECAMAREISMAPDKALRSPVNSDFSAIQACLIDIDTIENEVASHLLVGGALVLKATYRKRELIVMYTIERAYESFDSMEQLGNSLPARLEDQLAGRDLKWRLYEPDGNIFDHMAWALVSSQLDAIDALRFLEAPTTDVLASEVEIDTTEHVRIEQLAAAIPDWLRNASFSDIQDYSRYVTALGKVYRQPDYKAAKDEIPSITSYAQRLMSEAIIADPHAVGAADLVLDELRIKITDSFTVDDLTLPDPRNQHTETLADFALENEAPYLASIFFKNARQVPDWLTPEFLTTLSARVNIGEVYPALIKRKLIDDLVESRRQENFYIDQLRLLLPLMALESKVRQEAGIDEHGYRYIRELLNLDTETAQPIAIYPLSMTPQHRLISTSDTVANMYIISPRSAESGACLLYRPMLEPPLMQFPSRQNLLYALHQPGELRDSVLAWLPDKALSFEYAQYVFPVGLPSPWLVAEQVVDPLLRVDRFGHVIFKYEEITGNILSTLFKNNAQTIVDLADRQSQSNAERRWRLLKDSSWALFSVTSNFLSGAVGTAVWVWQTINEIQQALDARDQGDSFIEWTSVADILLALGIILSHHAVMRRKTASGKLQPALPIEEQIKPPTAPLTIALDPTPLVAELPQSHRSPVEVAGSVPRRTISTLGTYLDTLKVSAPNLADTELTTVNEAPPHLYQLNDKIYAQVGERWFNVMLDADAQVILIDPKDVTRTGPLLVHNQQGQWFVDTRLRLRGGGPKNRLKSMKAAKEQRKHELENALDSFKTQEPAKARELARAQTDLLTANGDAYDRMLGVYAEKLEVLINSYEQALEQLREWRTLGGTTGYTYDLLRLSTEMQKHLSLWFTAKKHQYIQATSAFTQAPQPDTAITRQTYIDNIRRATDLSHAMVEKLELSQTALQGMHAAGRPGIAEAIKISKLLPSFSALELKANEIGMAQELCMQEQASPTMSQARNAVGSIIVSAAEAAHRVADLMNIAGGNAAPQERIEDFGGLVDTFADTDQRIRELPDTYPHLFKQPQLDHLRKLIEEFSRLAHTQLHTLLPESEVLITQGSTEPARPGPSRLPVKVSKTRPRDPGNSEVTKAKEAPLKAVMPGVSVQPTPVLSDTDIIEAGLEQSLDVQPFIERTRKDALRPRRIPADMQDLFDQYALKLEQNATSVDLAMIRSKNAEGTPPPVATLSLELRQAAIKVREAGISTRASLYKERKPTQSSLKWMHENEQVRITRNEQGRIQTKQLGDYFQEYRILDKTNNDQALWVAHFHYETLSSPVDTPTTAHLKVADKYLETLPPEQRRLLTTVEPIDGVLRKIVDPSLRKLFLDLEPQATP